MRHLFVASTLLTLLLALGSCRATPVEPPPSESPASVPEPAATTEPTSTPTPEPPQVVIEAPPSNSTVTAGDELLLQVRAADAVGITRVELYAGSELVRTDFTPEDIPLNEYSLLQLWVAGPEGQQTLRVIAYRGDGTASRPAAIAVTVEEATGETAGDAAAPSASALPQPCTVTASTSLNVRRGPGAVYERAGVLNMGDQLTATGRYQDGSWWYVEYGGSNAWVAASHSYHRGDCATLPVVAAPSLPAGAASPTASITPGGPTLTPSATWTPTPSITPGGPTLTPSATWTATWTPTPSITPGGPTLTPSPTGAATATATATATASATTTSTATATPTLTNGLPAATPTFTPSPTHTPSPTFTSTSTAPVAPPDANFNAPLNIPLDSTASSTDFVSYPGGDTQDQVRWDITGMNPNASLSGGRARLIITASCFGTGTATIQFATGGNTFSCGQTVVDREVTYDSRTGQVTITATGGAGTYVQWVLTGSATRIN
jgi:hypothetical protein